MYTPLDPSGIIKYKQLLNSDRINPNGLNTTNLSTNLSTKKSNVKICAIMLATLLTATACSDNGGNATDKADNSTESTQTSIDQPFDQATEEQTDESQIDNETDKGSTDSQNSMANKSENQTATQLSTSGTINTTSIDVLPTLQYSTSNLSENAQKVNNSTWQSGSELDQQIGTKLQALLNWHHHGVGAVDGKWGKNTRKAMQAFQQAKGLTVTDDLDQATWDAINENDRISKQPVLVNYTLTKDDIDIKTTSIPSGAEAKGKLEGMYYESVPEAIAEKFHIDLQYLEHLNPNIQFTEGEVITVYNPGNPNTRPISRLVADKNSETLFAYDKADNLIASYPTTVGSTATPSPSGTHKVKVKVHEPNYTYTTKDGNQTIIPPGPNNPVGLVWIGLTKPSYGIHGSPDPERISRQASSGCIRLTNWDALALFGTIEDDATVKFK